MLEHKPHNLAVDNWCLGVLCYELIVGSAPFQAPEKATTFELIKSINYCKDSVKNEAARNLIDKVCS